MEEKEEPNKTIDQELADLPKKEEKELTNEEIMDTEIEEDGELEDWGFD